MPDQIFYVNSASIVDFSVSSSLYVATGTNVDFSQATQVSGSFVGTLQGNASTATTASYVSSASYAFNAVSASKALTASYVNSGQRIKAGSVSASAFSGNPQVATVTFTVPFPNNGYSVTVVGGDSRTWIVQSVTSGSFVINSNSKTAPTTQTYWQAIAFGEFNS